MLDDFRQVHFIGIGGSGLSAIAYLAKAQGLKVTGSDLSNSAVTESLEKEGIEIVIGQEKSHLDPLTELVIYTEAIDKNTNPEYLAAKEQKIPVLSYFEALGEMSEHKKTIVVAGTHGKTTTTAMLGQALLNAGEKPTVIVGTRVPAFENRNIYIGTNEWLVVEACEYRRSFLSFKPFGMVLLNCEWEHVDYYKTEEDYVKAFMELAEKIPEDGFLVYNAEDSNAKKVAEVCKGKRIAVTKGKVDELELNLQVPGQFNLYNAAHAYYAALETEVPGWSIKAGLSNFIGTARRMEIKGEKDGILIMDDYAHHPTEVRASLRALKEKYPDKRLICVFQPHQYSRTHQLLADFKTAFVDADEVIVPNIYEARDTEEDKQKIDAEKFALYIGGIWGDGFEKTIDWLKKNKKPDDLIVTMSAGDVYKIGESFLE